MCGILGLVRWAGLAPEDGERVRRGTRVLAHRGPDGEGFWQDEICSLGFRRLKIIDLSPAGDQPMANERGTLHVVFNGEIYNFQELCKELEAKGHTFRSKSDTEVLLHGYEEWGGEELLPKLRGMFAFAIWDSPNRKLFMARDPLGVKPLYFAERNGVLLFASEPKAFFATGLVKPELDPAALHEALTYRYVPAPRSGFKDVEKLPAGHLADAENQILKYRAWWTPQKCSVDNNPYQKSIAEQADEPDELFKAGIRGAVQHPGTLAAIAPYALMRSIHRRKVADVPIGIWLSGGIDSGLLLPFMRAGASTFTASFAQPAWDERKLALATAQQFNAQHSEFEIPADVFKHLPQIVWHADEPYFDSSCLPTFVLAERTKPHVSVVLSGDGGDEAFAGYERYAGIKYISRWKKVPKALRSLILRFARWTHPTPSRQGWDRLARWLDKCLSQESAGFHPYLGAVTLFEQEQIRALYGKEILEENQELDGREYVSNALRRSTKEKHQSSLPNINHYDTSILQNTDLGTYLSGDVLHKVDRMSMAHGLEVRSPFLDVDLVNLALSIPDEIRMPGTQTKPLLRQLASSCLPPEVVRARKRGFGVPLDDWFRGPLKKAAAEVFEASQLVTDGVFKPRYWEPYWKEHQEGRDNHGERLYALLALEIWHRTFLSGEPALERPKALE